MYTASFVQNLIMVAAKLSSLGLNIPINKPERRIVNVTNIYNVNHVYFMASSSLNVTLFMWYVHIGSMKMLDKGIYCQRIFYLYLGGVAV